jgi:TonB family protein
VAPVQAPLPVDHESLKEALFEEVPTGRIPIDTDVGSLPEKKPVRGEPPTNCAHLPLVVHINHAITTASYQLDPLLQSISETARSLTGATGAAIAMWKDGAVLCRASCGNGAPPLGAHLSVESGISGHCLRSGLIQHCGETLNDPRVDAELCRHLGLRSVAVLPIRGWRGVNGILEVFSTEPRAFAEQHFEILQYLAGLAERARAGQPETAPLEETKPWTKTSMFRLLPASDRVRDLASVLVSDKHSTVLLGALALFAVMLLGFAIWLGWRTPDGVKATTINAASPIADQAGSTNFRNSDSVWKPNAGGQAVSGSKRSPIIPATANLSPSKKVAGAGKAAPLEGSSPETLVRFENRSTAQPTESPAVDPPVLVASVPNPAMLSNVLSASAHIPELVAVPVSQGISNGYLIHQVAPNYPPQARMARLQGSVVMDALVAEDGTVQNLKVVSGSSTLARAAVDAVRQWRYKPYELNRKPVKMNTTITVNFKLP